MEKPTNKKPGLEANIGKKCKIIEATTAGLTGQVTEIKSVHGNDIEGYRYGVKIDKPLYDFGTWKDKLDFYLPTFLCEIL